MSRPGFVSGTSGGCRRTVVRAGDLVRRLLGVPTTCRRRFTSCQALDGLPGDLGYYLEVLIEVQDCEPGEFRGRRNNQVGH
jgi:hypothetical protein